MILIRGGQIVSGGKIARSDVLIDGGKIVKVSRGIEENSHDVIEAGGKFLLPGAIDSHVHFRDPESTSKEDFSSGSASALAGGVTSIMDMPNYRNPSTTTIAAYREKMALAMKKCRCDFLLRFGASETNFSEAEKSGAPQLKIFMTDTGSELSCSREATARHFATFPKNKPVCVHAEDRSRIAERAGKFSSQEEVQDKAGAIAACQFALEEAAKTSRRVHICHLTTAKEVDLCRLHPNATYEITPNHLFLTSADAEQMRALGKINPPLRDLQEQKALWRKLGKDTIIASDHAPHLVAHKVDGAPGYPGVGTLLPLLLDSAKQGRLTLPQVVLMACHNPAAKFGIANKGFIKAGMDADISLVDMGAKWKISADNRLSKCGWTPYEGREVYGRIEKVFLRGELAYDDGQALARPGFGIPLVVEG